MVSNVWIQAGKLWGGCIAGPHVGVWRLSDRMENTAVGIGQRDCTFK
jgi:hypothetical protein